jgi:hypothetical protein
MTDQIYEPLELVVKGNDKTVAYACGKCRVVVSAAYNAKDDMARNIAMEHCQPKLTVCKECGVSTKNNWTICKPCREAENFAKAEKINFEDWNGDPIFHGDDFHFDWDTYFSNWGLADREDWPAYVHASTPDHWKGIDIGDLFERELEEYTFGDYDPEVNDEDELKDFIKAWNKKQEGAVTVYHEDRKRVILIPNEVYEKHYG